ncbi:MAG: efflux RND transporter periplasmic adaptor subunit [Candidatus Brocadiia bacterium]
MVAKENDSATVNYELRRQARGAEPPEEESPWKRRLMVGGIALLVIIVGAVAYFMHWSWTHVRTYDAQVYAAVIDRAPEVSGIVKEVCVSEGDTVEPDAVLFRLEDANQKALLEAAVAEQNIQAAQLRQAEAELEQTRLQVEADIATARSRVRAAEAGVTRARAELALARAQTDDELKRARAMAEQARAEVRQLQKGARAELIEAAEARLAAAEALRDLYELEVQQSEQLVGEGIDSEFILKTKQTQLTTQRNRVREAKAELERLRAGATEDELERARQAVQARLAEVGLARAGEQEIKSLEAQLEIRTNELQQARAELEQAEAADTQIEVAEARAQAARAQLERARNEAKQRREALQQRHITSEVAGTVLRVVPDVGEYWNAGSTAVKIQVDSEGFWVNTYVREEDACRVKIGQPAEIEIVIGSGDYVKGEVAQISLFGTGMEGEATNPNQASRVWVKLRLLETPPDIRPGYSARATIEAG